MSTIWNTCSEKKQLATLFHPEGENGISNEKCSCRHISRTIVRILVDSGLNIINPVRLNFNTMVYAGATVSNIIKLYNDWCVDIDGILNLGSLDSMIDWMFATRKKDSLDKLNKIISKSLYNRYKERGIHFSESYREIVEDGEFKLKIMKDELIEMGISPRWQPGILWSLYSWAQMCDCCDRHKTKFPYYKSSSEWWISETEHSKLPEPWLGPRWIRILPEWTVLDSSFIERPDEFSRTKKNYPIILDCDFMPPSPKVYSSKKFILDLSEVEPVPNYENIISKNSQPPSPPPASPVYNSLDY